MRRRDALATVGTLALAGCLGLESPDQNGDDETESNESDLEIDAEEETEKLGGGDHENELELDRAWATAFDVEYGGRLVDETIYVAGAVDGDEGIVAVDPSGGEIEWTCDLGDVPYGFYLSAGPELVYVGSAQQDRIRAIDRRSGTIEATAEYGTAGGDSAIHDGTLVTGTRHAGENDVLVGLDGGTLEERWRRSAELAGFSGAVVADGVVVASYRNGELTGHDPADGSELWATEFSIAGHGYGPFVDDAGRVFAVDSERRAIARIDPTSGEQSWTIGFETQTGELPTIGPPAFDGDAGWIVAGRRVIAFDSVAGDRRWSIEIDGEVTSPVAKTGGTRWVHAVGSDSGRLYGFGSTDGELRYAGEGPADDSDHELFAVENRLAALENGTLVGYDVRSLE
ncbi:outer membrane protein assembly factor BamB family protein [Natrinema versiforme]|uniref:Pyrrolo-quinoline quinone n=1 Tax=Natrinema versiforme JCM 10478 TaxID=1227496 RepID=L9XUI2_9EURY|nr:PQQ-binding-like beta-propeller repeat protein [Natrinema versiforme]ELY65207.1 Pyrrolo-quinoline quinone [Natrinema versiforme JCM 10478]